MKVNAWQIAALVMQAVSEIEAVQAGQTAQLPPLHVTSGTTQVTINISVQDTHKTPSQA